MTDSKMTISQMDQVPTPENFFDRLRDLAEHERKILYARELGTSCPEVVVSESISMAKARLDQGDKDTARLIADSVCTTLFSYKHSGLIPERDKLGSYYLELAQLFAETGQKSNFFTSVEIALSSIDINTGDDDDNGEKISKLVDVALQITKALEGEAETDNVRDLKEQAALVARKLLLLLPEKENAELAFVLAKNGYIDEAQGLISKVEQKETVGIPDLIAIVDTADTFGKSGRLDLQDDIYQKVSERVGKLLNLGFNPFRGNVGAFAQYIKCVGDKKQAGQYLRLIGDLKLTDVQSDDLENLIDFAEEPITLTGKSAQFTKLLNPARLERLRQKTINDINLGNNIEERFFMRVALLDSYLSTNELDKALEVVHSYNMDEFEALVPEEKMEVIYGIVYILEGSSEELPELRDLLADYWGQIKGTEDPNNLPSLAYSFVRVGMLKEAQEVLTVVKHCTLVSESRLQEVYEGYLFLLVQTGYTDFAFLELRRLEDETEDLTKTPELSIGSMRFYVRDLVCQYYEDSAKLKGREELIRDFLISDPSVIKPLYNPDMPLTFEDLDSLRLIGVEYRVSDILEKRKSELSDSGLYERAGVLLEMPFITAEDFYRAYGNFLPKEQREMCETMGDSLNPLLKAWDYAGPDRSHLRLGNFRVMYELEVSRPGIVSYLSKEPSTVKVFYRYPQEVLVDMYDHKGDVLTPYGLAVVQQSDYNGVFTQNYAVWEDLYKNLKAHGFLLRITEWENNSFSLKRAQGSLW